MKWFFGIMGALWCATSISEHLAGLDAEYPTMMGMIHLAAFAILQKLDRAA